MNQIITKKQFFCLLFFFLTFWLSAQASSFTSSVALFPLWGDNEGIVDSFGEELFISINAQDNFVPWWVDMTNLPSDVPIGGFPPYVCPSPSTTRTSPFAVTGEVIQQRSTGLWRLRLYLWRMTDSRLIISDELSARDLDDCRSILPYILTWMFSQTREESVVRVVEQPTEQIRTIYFTASEPTKWLYLGLRGGGSMRIYSDMDAYIAHPDRSEIVSYENFHFAFHTNLQFSSFLGLQLEALYTRVLADKLESWSFMFPFMLKGSYRTGTISIAGFAGCYFWVPLGEVTNIENKYNFIPEDPPLGYTAGIMLGNKVGPGYIFIDVRWASDFKDHVNEFTKEHFHRSIFSLSLGYELGFFTKK